MPTRSASATPVPSPRSTGRQTAEAVALPVGEALPPADAVAITKSTPTRIILFIGEPDSGKTTLFSAIYQQFQSGPFAGYHFAGSTTLPGLERRCHLARIACNQERAATAHTSASEGLRSLHLRVRATPSSPVRDLLFSDVPGELLRQMSESREEMQRLTAVGRADHLVLLLDGQQLAKPAQRQAALSNGVKLLRTMLDFGMVDRRALVDVLITKWDHLDGQSEAPTLVAHIQKQLTNAKQRVGDLRLHQVAAKPDAKISQLPPAYGLAEIFPTWVEETHPKFAATPARPRLPDSLSEFDRLLLSRLPGRFAAEGSK